MGNGWDWLECEATVQDYFAMLNKELSGIKYNKTEHRRYLISKLNKRKLGERGEAFVIEYERYRLEQAGREDLAKEVQWSSNEQGDGLGYDIRSFNPKCDDELFIEVKTTNSGKYQPFFISENEVAFSKERAKYYSLYRVYDFRQQARIYQLNGAVDQYVNLQPQNYRASFS